MKRSLLTIAAVFVTASFAAPIQAQTANAQNNVDYTSADAETLAAKPLLINLMGADRVLYDYVQAITTRNYSAAYNLHSSRYQAQVPYEEFVRMYENSISTASINSVELLSNFSNDSHKEFRLQLDVTYLKTLPAGNGRFPEFFILVAADNGQWRIDGMAPGP